MFFVQFVSLCNYIYFTCSYYKLFILSVDCNILFCDTLTHIFEKCYINEVIILTLFIQSQVD